MRRISESPSSAGSASRSPVMYWELTLPGSSKAPLCRRPVKEKGSLSAETEMPRAFSTFRRSSTGRSGRRPLPVKEGSSQCAAATGSRKRRVEPLSRQSKMGAFGATFEGVTVNRPSSFRTSAPRALMTKAVVKMSSERGDVLFISMVTGPSAWAAQNRRRWTSLFDAMAWTVPERLAGLSRTFKRTSPFRGR